MLLLQLSCKLAELRSAGSSNHGCILVAELNELLSQFLLLWARLAVAREEEVARADSASEPFSLSKLDHQRCEHVLDLSITEVLGDSGQRLGSLVTNDSFILTSKLLKKA